MLSFTSGNFNHITEIIQKPKAVFRNSQENVGGAQCASALQRITFVLKIAVFFPICNIILYIFFYL